MKTYAKILALFLAAGLTLAVAVAASGCTGKEPKAAPKISQAQPEQSLAWPSDPTKSRIVFNKIIREPYDWGFKKSLPKKMLDLVLGKPFDTEFASPYAVTVGQNGITVVTDTSRGAIYLFDPVRGKYKMIHKAGKERLLSPVGATFDNAGVLYVADSNLSKIFKYDAKGKFIGQFAPDVSFKRPTCLATDSETGVLYAVDTEASEIVALDAAGSIVRKIDNYAGGRFNRPTHIAVGRDGTVAINDSLNFRIALFDRDGKYISSFGKNGDGTGDFARPRGVAIDSDGHIYVADALFDVIQIFDRDGKYLLAFGGTGGDPGLMYMPAGIFISPDNTILIADQGNRRIEFYRYMKDQQEAGQ